MKVRIRNFGWWLVVPPFFVPSACEKQEIEEHSFCQNAPVGLMSFELACGHGALTNLAAQKEEQILKHQVLILADWIEVFF